jgi:CheY-like chemotaxis protein
MRECTILVVEDDAIQRRQLARALAAEGHTVFQASSGLEAIEVLVEKDVQLILTDMVMPHMDGVCLLKYVRSHYAQKRVAVLTACPEGINGIEPDALLCKPFGERELKELVCLLSEETVS